MIRVTLSNGYYAATDENGKDWTGAIPLRILKIAEINDWGIVQKTYSNSKTFFKFVKDDKPDNLVKRRGSNRTTKKKIETVAPPESIEVSSELKEKFANHLNFDSDNLTDIQTMIEASVGMIPSYIKTDPLRWKALVRNTLRTKNVLLVGPSGEGKTLHARAIAEALGRPFERIDCGQTQDAEASLIGKTHYDPETGTFFNPSKLIKAIQTPNCVIALDEISRLTFEGQNLVFPLLDFNTRELVLTSEVGTPTIKVAPGVSFICTANIGTQFHASNAIDEALLNRLTMIEIKALTYDQRYELFQSLFNINPTILKNTLQIADDLNQELMRDDSKITKDLSTRQLEDIAGYLEDGFSPVEIFQLIVFPIFSCEGGAESERSYVISVFQKYFGSPDASSNLGAMNN